MDRYYQWMDSGIGRLLIMEESGNIIQIGLEMDTPEGAVCLCTPLLGRAKQQLAEYFAGKRQQLLLPLSPQGTIFQKRVWDALRQIPYGETVSYGQIASGVGCPGGARAVGMACNRNPLLIAVPCHRVVGADGRLVGFGAGLPAKEQLLALEQQYAAKHLTSDENMI